MKRYLAVDPGLRWVGVAHSDESGTIAVPHGIVDRKKKSPSNVLNSLIQEKSIDLVIVGYPTPLKAEENERTRQVDVFIEEFVEPLSVPHRVISERYSTREADRLRKERGQKEPAGDDEAAAMILQYFLDDHKDHSSRSTNPPQENRDLKS